MVSDRLGIYISSKEISYYAFENSIKASRGSISKAVKEQKSIGSTVIENILTLYNDLNPVWLMTGKGNMLLTEEDAKPDLSNVNAIEIINYISEHLEEFKKIKSFHLLFQSFQVDDDITKVKNEIKALKDQMREITESINSTK